MSCMGPSAEVPKRSQSHGHERLGRVYQGPARFVTLARGLVGHCSKDDCKSEGRGGGSELTIETASPEVSMHLWQSSWCRDFLRLP